MLGSQPGSEAPEPVPESSIAHCVGHSRMQEVRFIMPEAAASHGKVNRSPGLQILWMALENT